MTSEKPDQTTFKITISPTHWLSLFYFSTILSTIWMADFDITSKLRPFIFCVVWFLISIFAVWKAVNDD